MLLPVLAVAAKYAMGGAAREFLLMFLAVPLISRQPSTPIWDCPACGYIAKMMALKCCKDYLHKETKL